MIDGSDDVPPMAAATIVTAEPEINVPAAGTTSTVTTTTYTVPAPSVPVATPTGAAPTPPPGQGLANLANLGRYVYAQFSCRNKTKQIVAKIALRFSPRNRFSPCLFLHTPPTTFILYTHTLSLWILRMISSSAVVVCPHCNHRGPTRTAEMCSAVTLIAIVILLFVFWPLFWLPLCIPSCKSTEHYCTNCNSRLGRVEACS